MIDSDSWITHLTEIHTHMVTTRHPIIALSNQVIQIPILGKKLEFQGRSVEVLDDGSVFTIIKETILPVTHVTGHIWQVCDNTQITVVSDELDIDC